MLTSSLVFNLPHGNHAWNCSRIFSSRFDSRRLISPNHAQFVPINSPRPPLRYPSPTPPHRAPRLPYFGPPFQHSHGHVELDPDELRPPLVPSPALSTYRVRAKLMDILLSPREHRHDELVLNQTTPPQRPWFRRGENSPRLFMVSLVFPAVSLTYLTPFLIFLQPNRAERAQLKIAGAGNCSSCV